MARMRVPFKFPSSKTCNASMVVPPGDVNGLADYIVELLKDPATARAYGQAGKELAAEFDIDLMVRQQEELYEELLTRSDLT